MCRSSTSRCVLAEDPFTTLQVVLEPRAELPAPEFFQAVTATCQERPTYLDNYYSLQPGGLCGAKRLVVLLSAAWRRRIADGWIHEVTSRWASIVWHGLEQGANLAANEYAAVISA